MEKIISRRLRWKLETEQLISPLQSGFRQFKSTYDQLGIINEEICDALTNKHHLILASLELEKAYELVPIKVVFETCSTLNLAGNLLAFIESFLNKRKTKLRISNTVSDPIDIENGLPQGSVISVILFICVINSAVSGTKAPVKALLFADDVTLLCKGKNLTTINRLMQESLNKIISWS